MAVSDEFIDYVIDQPVAWGDVSARRMFGGAGLYYEGTMFGLIADDVAYLPSALRLRLEEKLDDSPSAVSRSGRSNRNREDFVKAGSSPFNPYPDKAKTAVMSYYEIPADILENPDELARWAERSLAIARNKK